MPLLPIIEAPDPRLRAMSAAVGSVDDDLRKLIADMFETMYAAPGIGLAAIQIGVPKRLLVIDLQEPEEEGGEAVRDPRVFVNPEIVEASSETRTYLEVACRSPINMPISSGPTMSLRVGSTRTEARMKSGSTASSRPASSTRSTTSTACSSSTTSHE